MELKKRVTQAGVVGSTLVASSAALANAEITTAITDAVTAGQSNYTLVVVGVIALAAIGFGLSAIVGAMRR